MVVSALSATVDLRTGLAFSLVLAVLILLTALALSRESRRRREAFPGPETVMKTGDLDAEEVQQLRAMMRRHPRLCLGDVCLHPDELERLKLMLNRSFGLCIEEVCVTKEQLKKLIENSKFTDELKTEIS